MTQKGSTVSVTAPRGFRAAGVATASPNTMYPMWLTSVNDRMRLSSASVSARVAGAAVVPVAGTVPGTLSTSTAAVTRRMRPGAWRVWVSVRSTSKLRTAVREFGPLAGAASSGAAPGVFATAPGTAVLVVGGPAGAHEVSEWEARQLELSRRA